MAQNPNKVNLQFGAVLPHVRLYGGVKRFFELGVCLQEFGHNMTIFTPDGLPPDWFSGHIEVRKLDVLPEAKLDVVFCTETYFLEDLEKSQAKRKVMYYVNPKVDLRILKKYPSVELFSNSSGAYEKARRKYKIDSFKALGGINLSNFHPKEGQRDPSKPFTVLVYGRLKRVKGTMTVVKACEKLHRKGMNIKLLLFDTPNEEKLKKEIKKFTAKVPYEFILNHPVEKNVELFHRADVFVSGERSAGYSNTSAEAMASGIPVIGTKHGTTDFLIHEETGLVVPTGWSGKFAKAIKRLADNPDEANRYASAGREKIKEFSWHILARQIADHFS